MTPTPTVEELKSAREWIRSSKKMADKPVSVCAAFTRSSEGITEMFYLRRDEPTPGRTVNVAKYGFMAHEPPKSALSESSIQACCLRCQHQRKARRF